MTRRGRLGRRHWWARTNLPLLAAGLATLLATLLYAGERRSWWRIPGLPGLEMSSIHARFQLRGPRSPEADDIVILGLDEKTRTDAPEVFQTRRGWADLLEAASDLVAVIREVRPQVMVTYDQFGGYGHPDHIQAHRVATYAASLAAVRSFRPELGEAWDVAKIYWGAMSEGRMREGLRRLREAGDTTSFEGMDPDGPLPPFLTPDHLLDAVVDGAEFVEAKMDAMRAHATQITVDGPFFALSNNVGNQVWGQEFYRLAKGKRGPVGEDGLETDLFAGLG